jgi:hypothetical protein
MANAMAENGISTVNTIYIMKSDGSLQVVSKVGTSEPNNIVINETPISSVNDINRQLTTYIVSDTNTYGNEEPNITIKSDDITILIFRKILYRRCTVYLVSQSSDKGSRILAYLYSKINHSAQSFGTDCFNVKMADIKKYIAETITQPFHFGID